MYQKQLELKMSALQFDIMSHKGTWYAWYYEIINNESLEEIVDGNTKDNRR